MAKTYGFDEFIDALGKLEKDFKSASNSLLEETANLAVAETQLRTPVGVGTPSPGNLRRSLRRGQVQNYEVEVGFGEEAPYAQYVEEGHRVGSSGFVPGMFMLRDGVTIAEIRFKVLAKKLFEDMTKGFKI